MKFLGHSDPSTILGLAVQGLRSKKKFLFLTFVYGLNTLINNKNQESWFFYLNS